MVQVSGAGKREHGQERFTWLVRTEVNGSVHFGATERDNPGQHRDVPYAGGMLEWVASAWEFSERTFWPILRQATVPILTLASLFSVGIFFISHGQHGEWIAWITLVLVVVVFVQFRELHKRRGHNEDEIAKGLRELDLLENARQFVRLILTRNEGRDDLANYSHWNNWAAEVDGTIERSSMDLSFLQPLPPQWRKREINDDALQLADEKLLALIQEREHFRNTKFAFQHQAKHGA